MVYEYVVIWSVRGGFGSVRAVNLHISKGEVSMKFTVSTVRARLLRLSRIGIV